VELLRRLNEQPPANEDRKEGYALVNVLEPEAYAREHIPNSINIPEGKEDEFDRQFEKTKRIIVYCSSSDCEASGSVAKRLIDQGFNQVIHYEGGMSDWKNADYPIAGKNQYKDEA
jgi:thiosulfate sulfurtransferase